MILRRDEIKEKLKKRTNSNLMSQLTKRIGQTAQELENKNYDILEEELIEISAVCLIWIEELRKKERVK